MDDPCHERLVEVAKAYYLESRTQAEIARSLGISRSQVSRYLSEAHEIGIVQIRIVDPCEKNYDLGVQLQERYPHLQHVIAAPVFHSDPEARRTIIGRYAANYVAEIIRPEQRIVLGCGRTLRAFVNALPKRDLNGIVFVQAMGNLGHEALDIDYNEITRQAAESLGGRVYYVSAPAILGNGSGTAANFIAANAMLDQALSLARTADVFVVGLGSMETDLIYTNFGLIQEDELNNLSGHTAGDICGRFFDINGDRRASDFEDRIVGIELEDLKRAQLSIGVAGGTDKVAPLLGAIRGQWINVVVTDEQTLHSILALDDAYPPEA